MTARQTLLVFSALGLSFAVFILILSVGALIQGGAPRWQSYLGLAVGLFMLVAVVRNVALVWRTDRARQEAEAKDVRNKRAR